MGGGGGNPVAQAVEGVKKIGGEVFKNGNPISTAINEVAKRTGIGTYDVLGTVKNELGSGMERVMTGKTKGEATQEAADKANASAAAQAVAQTEADKTADLGAQAAAVNRRRTSKPSGGTLLTASQFAGPQTGGKKTLLGQ